MSLSTHPDLLQLVLAHLDTPDLATCLRINLLFHQIAGPLLYRSVVIGDLDRFFLDCRQNERHSNPGHRAVQRFKPALLAHVRFITILPHNDGTCLSSHSKESLDAIDLSAVQALRLSVMHADDTDVECLDRYSKHPGRAIQLDHTCGIFRVVKARTLVFDPGMIRENFRYGVGGPMLPLQKRIPTSVRRLIFAATSVRIDKDENDFVCDIYENDLSECLLWCPETIQEVIIVLGPTSAPPRPSFRPYTAGRDLWTTSEYAPEHLRILVTATTEWTSAHDDSDATEDGEMLLDEVKEGFERKQREEEEDAPDEHRGNRRVEFVTWKAIDKTEWIGLFNAPRGGRTRVLEPVMVYANHYLRRLHGEESDPLSSDSSEDVYDPPSGGPTEEDCAESEPVYEYA